MVVTVVNLDPHHAQSGHVEVPLEAFRIDPAHSYQADDLLGGGRHTADVDRRARALEVGMRLGPMAGDVAQWLSQRGGGDDIERWYKRTFEGREDAFGQGQGEPGRSVDAWATVAYGQEIRMARSAEPGGDRGVQSARRTEKPHFSSASAVS